jgi:hypothetical protein
VNLRRICSLLLFPHAVWCLGCVPTSILDGQEGSLDPVDSEDPADSEEEEESYPEAEEGSCTAWKFAYCDAIVACSAFVTREQCELDLGWLVCQDSAPLGECQKKIERAVEDDACDELPEECGPSAIADRTLAIELCQNIHTAMCEQRLFCGLEFSAEACLDSLSRSEPCEAFTSFLPTAVDCAKAYSRLACDEGMPEVCAGSLRY